MPLSAVAAAVAAAAAAAASAAAAAAVVLLQLLADLGDQDGQVVFAPSLDTEPEAAIGLAAEADGAELKVKAKKRDCLLSAMQFRDSQLLRPISRPLMMHPGSH